MVVVFRTQCCCRLLCGQRFNPSFPGRDDLCFILFAHGTLFSVVYFFFAASGLFFCVFFAVRAGRWWVVFDVICTRDWCRLLLRPAVYIFCFFRCARVNVTALGFLLYVCPPRTGDEVGFILVYSCWLEGYRVTRKIKQPLGWIS